MRQTSHPLRKGARELRALRARLSLTAKEIALGVGLSVTNIEHIEMGYIEISPEGLNLLKIQYKNLTK